MHEAALKYTYDHVCTYVLDLLLCSHSQTPQYYKATPLMKDTAAVNRIVLF